jgi:transposase
VQSAEFVYRMEDVLDIYHLPYDPNFPYVCFDESNKQLVAEKRSAVEPESGQVERYDYEYQRNGVRNLFLFFSPLVSWRHVKVTEQRTHQEWADCMKDLVDVHFPQATRIRVIQDNLNTHNPAFLYEVFEPAEAKRILDKLEFHYTPKHGSWLNMAEIEFSVLSRQCLDRRIPDNETLIQEIRAWEGRRNAIKATVDWQFTTKDARTKLKKLYPSIHD